MAGRPIIDTSDFRDLARDFAHFAPELRKDMVVELRVIGNKARDRVRGSVASPYATGTLRRSVRTSVRGAYQVALYSNLPQAAVWEFGGRIHPRGAPIQIPRTEFVRKEVLASSQQIDDELAQMFGLIAAKHQFL